MKQAARACYRQPPPVVAEPALEGAEVLVRSVSAAQGILLGLGGD